jgi:hypothetical protein
LKLAKELEAGKLKRGEFSGLTRKRKRNAMARKEDEKEIKKQKLVARTVKKGSKAQKIGQFAAESTAKKPEKRKKKSAFDEDKCRK